MVEDEEGGEPSDEQGSLDRRPLSERPRGSGVIFALIALALILAIAFFYVTREREQRQDETTSDAVESVNSAAHIVGNAAESVADQLH